MLRLSFRAFDNRTGGEVSAEAFTLDHGNLETWPEGRLVARHVENQWQVNGRLFVRFECGPGATCLFETGDRVVERYGPFEDLSCVDGVVWAGADAVAALKNGEWASMATKRAWPRLRLAFSSGGAAGLTRP